jgi:GPI mannosyltransferase 3
MILAAALRVGLALTSFSHFWPDEIYQTVEQAHRVVFGFGFVPWEFQLGARTWIFPGALAGLLAAGSLFGLSPGAGVVAFVKLTMIAIDLLGLVAAVGIARRLKGPVAGLLAAGIAGFFPLSIYFAGRAMTEVAAGGVFSTAVLGALRKERWSLRASGGLAALAFLIRYQMAVAAVGLFVFVLWSRPREERRHAAIELSISAAIVIAAGGVIDWLTWGVPFLPFAKYVSFNLLAGGSAKFGTSPPLFYLSTLWSACGIGLLALALLWGRAGRTGLGLLAVAIAFVVVHSFIGHKEVRFIAPVLPIACAAAAAGACAFVPPARSASIAPAIALAFALFFGHRAVELTWDQVGRADSLHPVGHSVWSGIEDDMNRLAITAARSPDLCGLGVSQINPIWLGGYTTLGRDVPFMFVPFEQIAGPTPPAGLNHFILPKEAPIPAWGKKIAEEGTQILLRSDQPCGGTPPHFTRLFDLPPS